MDFLGAGRQDAVQVYNAGHDCYLRELVGPARTSVTHSCPEDERDVTDLRRHLNFCCWVMSGAPAADCPAGTAETVPLGCRLHSNVCLCPL